LDEKDIKGQGYNKIQAHEWAHPAPYPEIRVARKDPYYAKLLLEDYAGAISELTAITQYMYHYFVLESEYEDVARLLSGIGIVEMHHQEMLAETIWKLGVDPRYRTIEKNEMERYWDANFVFYGTSLCDRISADIAGEWAAISNYRRHQQMIDDPYIKRILARIILDELHHIELFNQVLRKYCEPHLFRNNSETASE